MRKIIFIFGVAFAFSACTQCQDCNFASESTTAQVCRNDYDSNEDYQTALLLMEESGAVCQ